MVHIGNPGDLLVSNVIESPHPGAEAMRSVASMTSLNVPERMNEMAKP